MEKVLLVDASPLAYATFNSVGHLCTKEGEPTGLRYGFLRTVRSYGEKLRADRTAIVFDAPGPIRKAEGASEYKANRTLTEEKADMYAQFPALREMLGLTKWAQIEAPGYEADDCIAAVARDITSTGHQAVIISPDNDMMQLVDDQTTIFRPGSAKKKTKDRLITDKDVFLTYGVHPEYLCIYRTVFGDPSDNLQGILAGGDLKQELADVLRRAGRRPSIWPCTPDDLDQLLQKTDGASPLRKLMHSTAVRDQYNVMRLHNPPNLELTEGKKDREGLLDLFEKLEFNSMLQHVDELTGTGKWTSRQAELNV